MHLAGNLEEPVAVAPDEEDLEQLEPQVAPLGLALDRELDQIGGLVVQAIGHVEVGFGQRVARLDADRRIARQRVVERRGLACGLEARPAAATGTGRGLGGGASTGRFSSTRMSASRGASLTGLRAGRCRAA